MKRILRIIPCLICLCLIAGCIPQKYDKEKEAEIEAEGRVLLEEYAESLPGGGEIVSLYMMSGYEEGGSPYTGSYLSNIVRAKIKTADRNVDAVVNIKTGEIFTDYYMQNVNEAVKCQLQPYFELAGINAEELQVSGAEIYKVVVSPGMDTIHKNGAKVNSIVALDGMISSEITETDIGKWADIVLKDAKLSAFKLSFETDSGEFPGISFLTDYLGESGNYIKQDDNVFGGITTYRISVSSKGDPDILGWYMEAQMTDTPDNMEFSVLRKNRKTEGAFTFLYNGAEGYINSGNKEPELTEKDCPVTVEGDVLHYFQNHGGVQLIFTEKPPYTVFERITYQDRKPNEPEELQLVRLSDGTYSLTDGSKTHENGYIFTEQQDIRCK